MFIATAWLPVILATFLIFIAQAILFSPKVLGRIWAEGLKGTAAPFQGGATKCVMAIGWGGSFLNSFFIAWLASLVYLWYSFEGLILLAVVDIGLSKMNAFWMGVRSWKTLTVIGTRGLIDVVVPYLCFLAFRIDTFY